MGFWRTPAVIAENNFIYRSLPDWAFNVAVGCSHACRFCYVPSVSRIKQAAKLAEYVCSVDDQLAGREPKSRQIGLRTGKNEPRPIEVSHLAPATFKRWILVQVRSAGR